MDTSKEGREPEALATLRFRLSQAGRDESLHLAMIGGDSVVLQVKAEGGAIPLTLEECDKLSALLRTVVRAGREQARRR